MRNLKIKKIRAGRYEAKDNGYKLEIDQYEGKWIGILSEDDEQEAYWEGSSKKEIIGCVRAYFAI